MKNIESVKFSILIPAFKSAFFEETIESIIRQTYSNLEIIIVDDNSPEDLKSIVTLFDDKRIHYYRNEKNFGAKDVVLNWNKCLGYASGDYVLCMGDDDKLSVDCLNLYYQKIKEYPCVDVFHIQTLLIDEDSRICGIQESRPENESVYSVAYNKFIGRLQYVGDWLFKLDTLKSNGGFFNLPFAWYSDDITPLIIGRENGIVNINEFGFLYRVNRLTISSNVNNIDGKSQAAMEAFKWYNDFFSEHANNNRDRIFCNRALAVLPIVKRMAMESFLTDIMKVNVIKGFCFYCKNSARLDYTLKSLFKSVLKSFF